MSRPFLPRLFAALYALASQGLRLWHGLTRKALRGAQVSVWAEDRILLIKSTYRNAYGFPGGYLRTGERPESAAQRELNEEVGVWRRLDQLKLISVNDYADRRLRGTDWIFETRIASQPTLTLDPREVESAQFYELNQALTLPLESHVKKCLLDSATTRRLEQGREIR